MEEMSVLGIGGREFKVVDDGAPRKTDIGDAEIVIMQGGVVKGSFTVNAKSDEPIVIQLDKGSEYTLPIATSERLGGVKPDGETITIDDDGTIHGAEQQSGTASNIIFDNEGTGLESENVQDAIEEINSTKLSETDADELYLSKNGDTITNSYHKATIGAEEIKVERLDRTNYVRINENGEIEANYGSYTDDSNRSRMIFYQGRLFIEHFADKLAKWRNNVSIFYNEIRAGAYEGLPFFRLFISQDDSGKTTGNLDVREGDVRIVGAYEGGNVISLKEISKQQPRKMTKAVFDTLTDEQKKGRIIVTDEYLDDFAPWTRKGVFNITTSATTINLGFSLAEYKEICLILNFNNYNRANAVLPISEFKANHTILSANFGGALKNVEITNVTNTSFSALTTYSSAVNLILCVR